MLFQKPISVASSVVTNRLQSWQTMLLGNIPLVDRDKDHKTHIEQTKDHQKQQETGSFKD